MADNIFRRFTSFRAIGTCRRVCDVKFFLSYRLHDIKDFASQSLKNSLCCYCFLTALLSVTFRAIILILHMCNKNSQCHWQVFSFSGRGTEKYLIKKGTATFEGGRAGGGATCKCYKRLISNCTESKMAKTQQFITIFYSAA